METLDKPIPSPVNPGDIVFFKSMKRSSAPAAPELKVQGYGFGILLGNLPPTAKREPTSGELLQLMGGVGFVLFDDVIEFLGEEHADNLLKKFQDKYHVEEVKPIIEDKKIIQTEAPTGIKIIKDMNATP